MTPEESQAELGAMLARVLDNAEGEVVGRAILIYEVIRDDDQSQVSYETTDGVTWTDHIGLLRQAQLHAEALILSSHLDQPDDE